MYADKLFGLTDEALLDHYHKTRDFSAFKLLYQRHRTPLYRYCVQIGLSRGDTLLHALWAGILEKPPELYGRLLKNWLYIQINRIIRDGIPETLAASAGTAENIPEKTVTENVMATLQDNPVLNAIQQLPRQQRNIFLLHRECQLSLATVADIERLTLRQCREALHQAIQSLEIRLCGPFNKAWQVSSSVLDVNESEIVTENPGVSLWQRTKTFLQKWKGLAGAREDRHSNSGTEKLA